MQIEKRKNGVDFSFKSHNLPSTNEMLLGLLSVHKLNYEELAHLLKLDGGNVRSRIHVLRETYGYPIIDETYICEETGRKRKRYYRAKNESEYLQWRCDQAYSSIPIRKGAPAYNHNR